MRSLLLLGLLLGAAHAAPTAYTLDKESVLLIKVYKDTSTLASGQAHDHVIVARRFDGTVLHDAAQPTALRAGVTVWANGLEADPPRLRILHGVKGTLDPDDRAKVKKNMLAADQLDARRHPTITFNATSAAVAGDKIELTGKLKIRGVTREVKLPVTVRLDKAGRFRGEGTVRINCNDFGFKPYSALLGAVANRPDMDLLVSLVASPKP